MYINFEHALDNNELSTNKVIHLFQLPLTPDGACGMQWRCRIATIVPNIINFHLQTDQN